MAVARALVKRPRLVLFDEPTGNLESAIGAQLLDHLGELHHEERVTFLLVTHDDSVWARASRVLTLPDGSWQNPAL